MAKKYKDFLRDEFNIKNGNLIRNLSASLGFLVGGTARKIIHPETKASHLILVFSAAAIVSGASILISAKSKYNEYKNQPNLKY